MERKYLSVLGHQPDLSIAELEILYGHENIEVGNDICFLSKMPEINRLGGSPKTAQIIGELPKKSSFVGIDEVIFKSILPHLEVKKKINFGISTYINNHNAKQLKQIALQLKKRLISVGFKPRFIPNKNKQLNSAQVWHNKLDRLPNFEILLIDSKDTIYIARTLGVQNIDAFTKRDRDKPVRDAKVGMLPPKLARQMINFANPKGKILDPFCGTGTLLMEAALMGFDSIGSDISLRMVEASQKNIDWLKKKYAVNSEIEVFEADAQEFNWNEDISCVVTESYLGPPLSKFPDNIEEIKLNINTRVKATLRNFSRQNFSKNYICVAIPAWFDSKTNQYHTLPLVDELESLKYNLVDLKHVNAKRLIYRRTEQIVARQMLIIKRS